MVKRRLLVHDSSKTLSDPDLIFRTFIDCLREGDPESAREVLAGGLRQLKKSHLESRYRIPRRTAYNLLDKKANPGLNLIAKVCQAINRESGQRAES